MASILDRYGIKEVADVVFYELDSKGAPSAPVLYLDTLKVSTIEQSAEVVDATGGKGNVKLISWDTNKEVTATFEDALFSVKSLAIMFGGEVRVHGEDGASQEVLKTLPKDKIKETENEDGWEFTLSGNTYVIAKSQATYFRYEGSEVKPTTAGDEKGFDFITFDLLDATKDGGSSGLKGLEINITAEFGDNTYYITGDTFARDYQSGKDEFLQFIIPKGKVSAEDLSLTMEADGDPATFSMNINVLRAADGTMFKLVKYTLGNEGGESGVRNKGVASVLTQYDSVKKEENAGWASGVPPVHDSLPSWES